MPGYQRLSVHVYSLAYLQVSGHVPWLVPPPYRCRTLARQDPEKHEDRPAGRSHQ